MQSVDGNCLSHYVDVKHNQTQFKQLSYNVAQREINHIQSKQSPESTNYRQLQATPTPLPSPLIIHPLYFKAYRQQFSQTIGL